MNDKKKKNRVYRFFTSKVLAITLIIILGLMAFLGTVIPQEDVFSAEEILDHDARRPVSRILNNIFSVVHISDQDPWKSSVYSVYHSWWFMLAIMLLSINLIVCSWDKLQTIKHVFKKMSSETGSDSLKKRKPSAFFSISANEEKTLVAVRKWTKKKFRVREEAVSKKETVFKLQKFRFSRLGYLLVHIGLLLVFAGSLVSSFTREKGNVWLSDGESTQIYYSRTDSVEKPLGYTLKAEDLKKIMYKDSSAVKDWHSTLTIIKDGKDLVKKEIEVNDPLFYEGRRFYQSAWQEGYKLNIKVTEKATGNIEEFPIEVGINYYNVEGIDKTYSFGGGKAFFRLDRFYPHFIMSGKQFSSRSANLVNPGAVIQVYWPGLTDDKRKVLFSRFADMDFGRMHDREEKKGEEPFKFTLDKKIGTSYITGLEIGEDPGTDVVYAGFLFMILGVIVGFYFYHQTIWIGVKKKGSKTELVIAGMATRNKYQFERKFERLVSGFSLYLADELEIDKNKIKIENSKQEE